MTEPEFLALLRTLPLHPGALGLMDDAARLSGDFVVTTDTLVEGVHFLSDDPAGDVAWKLVAVNLSDLAAKGARPVAVLLNYPLGDDGWDRAFVAGLGEALAAFDCPLLGGDTVSLPKGAPRVLTLTAFGESDFPRQRSHAQAGDRLWVTGSVGDAGVGLSVALGAPTPDGLPNYLATHFLDAYRRPRPLLNEGQLLAPQVHAMCDVSDGLLIDANRMASASGLSVTIELNSVPMSPGYRTWSGDPLAAATSGDDYQLLFAMHPRARPPVGATLIGAFSAGSGLTLTRDGAATPLPDRLGWLHRA